MTQNNASLRLHQAITLNDLSLVKRILNANPRLLHIPLQTEKAETSLHVAACLGLVLITQHLIDLGHDGNIQSKDEICSDPKFTHGISINTNGQTPLHLASANLHTEIVQLLCENFPTTINRKDSEGRAPLLLAAGVQMKNPVQNPSTTVSRSTTRSSEDISTLSTLLLYGADVSTKDFRGNTCLHYACAFGNLKAIRALIQAGADPLQMNFEGWKPELYSLTVQAEVYYRNIVNEVNKQMVGELRVGLDRKSEAGGVRIVSQKDDDSDDASSTGGRDRADSGRSESTFQSAMS